MNAPTRQRFAVEIGRLMESAPTPSALAADDVASNAGWLAEASALVYARNRDEGVDFARTAQLLEASSFGLRIAAARVLLTILKGSRSEFPNTAAVTVALIGAS
jgi:hypothetical protein